MASNNAVFSTNWQPMVSNLLLGELAVEVKTTDFRMTGVSIAFYSLSMFPKPIQIIRLCFDVVI